MKALKFLIGAVGTVTLVIGISLMAIAVGLFTWIGTDDVVRLPQIHVSSDDNAIVADDIEVLFDDHGRLDIVPDLGDATITVSTPDGRPVFVGVGPDDRVRSFLSTGADPADGSFWIVADTGERATIDWRLEPGDWSFVVMAPDGADGLDLSIDAEVTAVPFRAAGAIAGGTGLATAIAGGLMLAAALANRSTPPVHPAPAAA